MLKYWIKTRLIFDFTIVIVLSVIFSLAFINSPNSLCKNIESLNIVYLKSDIDFQIPNPSVNQLQEINDKSFVQNVFGYYLTNTTINGKNSAKLKVIMSDYMKNLKITMYNEETKISSIENVDNYAYLDKKAADELGVICGDEITIYIAGENVKYIVCSIFQSNQLFKDGSVIVEFSGEIKSIYESNVSSNSYSAAFIDALSNEECADYLKNYIPLGRLRDRSNFNTDEEYNAYNNAITSGNYSNEITNFTDMRKQVKKELVTAEKSRSLAVYIGASVIGIIYLILNSILRIRHSEKKYFKEILKNKKSIGIYRISSFIFTTITYCFAIFIMFRFINATDLTIISLVISFIYILCAYILNTVLDHTYVRYRND